MRLDQEEPMAANAYGWGFSKEGSHSRDIANVEEVGNWSRRGWEEAHVRINHAGWYLPISPPVLGQAARNGEFYTLMRIKTMDI